MASAPTRVLVPSGALGISFDHDAFRRGLEQAPDIICIDGGSTDSGPYYLGTGTSKYSRTVTRSEWRTLMQARAEVGVPLMIGTSGTCGTDASVDWMLDITAEIAAELGTPVKVATLKSEQPASRVADALASGRVHTLAGAPAFASESVGECSHIVALAGAEQMAAALDTGADIVIAGRATDTATIAALPLQRGASAGGAWHGAKIAECGALCSSHPTTGVVLVDFDADGFTVEPMAAAARCTPHSVSAHMLYENSDPLTLYEPGGRLEVDGARYEQIDDRRVRVTRSRWVDEARYTVKLEGARAAGFQTTMMAVLRDARYVANARTWIDGLQGFAREQIATRMGLGAERYQLEFRLIGIDAALGALENRAGEPVEVGVLGIVTADEQALATEIAKLINPWLLHYPLTADEELPTFAFPYSPAETERGALYEFCLHHVMELDDPMDAFQLDVVNLGA